MRDGLLLVDKERGCTSHDVVQAVRRRLRQKKVGHCGTLDPDATGLLLLTLGRATRLTRFLIRAPKVYEGEIRFGQATDTYDGSGNVVAEKPVEGVTDAVLRKAMQEFEGDIEQTPPPFCATKVGGVKFYELARRGEAVPEKSKPVHIYSFTPSAPFDGERLRFRLRCSSGTYARSLAHELGQKVASAAHLSSLRRLQIGTFKVDDAARVDEIDSAFTGNGSHAFVDFDEIPLPFEEIEADSRQERRITHGQTLLVRDQRLEEGDWVKVINRQREFLAVGSVVERIGEDGVRVIQPKIVFR